MMMDKSDIKDNFDKLYILDLSSYKYEWDSIFNVVESLKNLQITGSDLILKTATGEAARVLGEADVRLELGSVEVIHRVVVADIVDDFILGLDVMNKFGFVLDIKNRMLQTGNEEISLQYFTDLGY
ncbi:hypothetical protein MTP99_007374 [Tenebrio molitor]|nr:hypothetical protein MTP99_007374 [Tenebrio molitor]